MIPNDETLIDLYQEYPCCGVEGHSFTCNQAEWRYGDTTQTASKPCELHGVGFCPICCKRVGECEWGDCAGSVAECGYIGGVRMEVCSKHAERLPELQRIVGAKRRKGA